MEEFIGNWNYPTSIKFGPNTTKNLANCCKELNFTSPLIVTDQNLITHKVVNNILDMLQDASLNYKTFSNIKPNPTEDNIIAGVMAFNTGEHDGIICIGGGSAIDAGKTIAFMSKQDKSIWEFEDIGDNFKKANPNFPKIIAIPTTAGTGSEVGRASVILDEINKTKKIIFHPNMLPTLVIADPMLTIDLPPHLTAATGMDALIHNLEAYLSPTFHPLADGIAINGIRLISESIFNAYTNGENIKARSKMLAASIMGATAFQKGLGAIHSMSHAVGAVYDKHHGLLNAIIAPIILAHNEKAIINKITTLNTILGLKDTNFSTFLNWILDLRSKLDIPSDLKSIGLDTSKCNLISKLAFLDPSTNTNPIKISEEDFRELFSKAIG